MTLLLPAKVLVCCDGCGTENLIYETYGYVCDGCGAQIAPRRAQASAVQTPASAGDAKPAATTGLFVARTRLRA